MLFIFFIGALGQNLLRKNQVLFTIILLGLFVSLSVNLPKDKAVPLTTRDNIRATFSKITPQYFLGKWSWQVEGSISSYNEKELPQYRYPFRATLKHRELKGLNTPNIQAHIQSIELREKGYKMRFQEPIVVSPKARTLETLSWKYKKSRALLIQRALISWKKQYGNSMGSNFLQALLLGFNHHAGLSYIAQRFGFSHLLAISGLHFFTLIALLSFVCKKIKPDLRAGILWSLSFCYALWIGLDNASVFRAFCMCTIWFLYTLFQRYYDAKNAWALSLVTALLISPSFLNSLSFQLSYAATFAILFIFPNILTFFKELNKPHHRLVRMLLPLFHAICLQASILFVILPLLFAYFHKFSLCSFWMNLIISPLAMIILAIAFILFPLDFILSHPSFTLIPCKKLIEVCNTFFLFLADLPRYMDMTLRVQIEPWLAVTWLFIVTIPFIFKSSLHNPKLDLDLPF